jgi:transcriptional regulator with XRE-family HTH domain
VVEFGPTLARMRRAAGQSQLAVARALSLDLTTIERLERGDQRAPDRQLVLDLARVLALSEPQTDELLWAANHLPLRAVGAEPPKSRAVALFVDHENVYIALMELLRALPPDAQAIERRRVEPAWLASCLRTAAEKIGWIKVALVVADWERLPPGQVKEYLKLRYQIDYNLPGRNNADLKLSDAIRNVLEDDEYADVDTYVLVTGDGGYLAVLDTLLRRQKNVQVWGVRGATNAVLQRNATTSAWVEDLVGMPAPRPPQIRADPDDGRVNLAPLAPVDAVSPNGHAAMPLGNEVSRLEAMAIHLARHLRTRSWTFITFVRFLSFLNETEVFGPTREEQLAWLTHAKETGVLREEVIDDPNDSTRIARRFYLNENHPLVERALQIRTRVGEVVPAAGRGLAFGMVIDRLVNDPELQLNDVQAKSWLTWFTDAGYLQAEGVPHFRKEGVTVTLLRQNPGYWDTPAAPDEASSHDNLQALSEFGAVRLANFLERHPHFGWMALSQLLNQMTDGVPGRGFGALTLTRQTAKQVIALAQESGLLSIEQIPNLKTGGATTVARLNRDAARIQDLLAMRDSLVRRLAEMLTSRPAVSRSLFQATIADRTALSFDDAAAWIDLLAGEGLFVQEVDHDGAVTSLRADLQDLIVSRVLYGSLHGASETIRVESRPFGA